MAGHDTGAAFGEPTARAVARLEGNGRERGRRGTPRVGPTPDPGVSVLAAEGARWASDADSPCYAHLGAAFSADAFRLTGAVMRALCEVNAFQVDDLGPQVLFGLRGCRILTPPPAGRPGWTEMMDGVDLAEDVPDHFTWRCTLGVWDRDTDRVGVVSGSTVPNVHWMRLCVQGKDRANLLPTGSYRYDVGTHRGTPGCFMNPGPYAVLRTFDALCYTRSDTWDRRATPGDNIHCTPHGEHGAAFSSAGCQTAWGWVDGGNHRGFFAQLREMAGLTPKAVNEPRAYRYVLLTGRDARLMTTAPDPGSLRRLRFGSRGPRVAQLAAALRALGKPAPATDVLDVYLREQLIGWQQERSLRLGQGRAADDVLTPAEAAELGV